MTARRSSIAGDGGFLFTGNELATAVQHEIPLVCAVFDDGAFGNVKRMQQQKFGDDRTIASTLRNPDFVAYARSFGALGLHATSPAEFRIRLDEAFESNQPTIIHVETTGDARSVAASHPRPGARCADDGTDDHRTRLRLDADSGAHPVDATVAPTRSRSRSRPG